MWDPPGPGIEPMFPALAGGFFTTEPPGKPGYTDFYGSFRAVVKSTGFGDRVVCFLAPSLTSCEPWVTYSSSLPKLPNLWSLCLKFIVSCLIFYVSLLSFALSYVLNCGCVFVFLPWMFAAGRWRTLSVLLPILSPSHLKWVDVCVSNVKVFGIPYILYKYIT